MLGLPDDLDENIRWQNVRNALQRFLDALKSSPIKQIYDGMDEDFRAFYSQEELQLIIRENSYLRTYDQLTFLDIHFYHSYARLTVALTTGAETVHRVQFIMHFDGDYWRIVAIFPSLLQGVPGKKI